MARWESGSQERLAEAALRLFGVQGFEATTVAEIAAEAGVTERTFFRYYADKREVLFAGSDRFAGAFTEALASSSATGAFDLITAALVGAGTFFDEDRRAWARARSAVLNANPQLAERELHKMAALATTLTDELVARGIDPTTAALTAQSGITVFRQTFAAWIEATETRPFDVLLDEVLDRFRSLLA